MKKRTCDIHPGVELYETHPADAENGPRPSDCYNELRCEACDVEESMAYFSSVCLAHRKRMNDCLPCTVDEDVAA